MYLELGTIKNFHYLFNSIPAYHLPGERVRCEVVETGDVVKAVGYKKMQII